MRIEIDDIMEESEGGKVGMGTNFCLVTVAEKLDGLVITVHSRMTHFDLTVDPEGFTGISYDTPAIVFDKEEPASSLAAKAGF